MESGGSYLSFDPNANKAITHFGLENQNGPAYVTRCGINNTSLTVTAGISFDTEADMTNLVPAARTAILTMCNSWIIYMTAARRTAWGVPQDQYNELSDLYDAAQALCHNPASVPDYGIGVSAKPKLQAKAFVTAPSMAPEANV